MNTAATPAPPRTPFGPQSPVTHLCKHPRKMRHRISPHFRKPWKPINLPYIPIILCLSAKMRHKAEFLPHTQSVTHLLQHPRKMRHRISPHIPKPRKPISLPCPPILLCLSPKMRHKTEPPPHILSVTHLLQHPRKMRHELSPHTRNQQQSMLLPPSVQTTRFSPKMRHKPGNPLHSFPPPSIVWYEN